MSSSAKTPAPTPIPTAAPVDNPFFLELDELDELDADEEVVAGFEFALAVDCDCVEGSIYFS